MTRAALLVDEQAEAYARLLAERGHHVTALRPGTERPDLFGEVEILIGSPQVALDLAPNLPALRFFQSTWAGVDVFLPAAGPDVIVARVGDVFGQQIREFVYAHLLARTQRVVERTGATIWDPQPAVGLAGSLLGVLGTGSLGRAIAATGRHLGMRVRGCSKSGKPVDVFDEIMSNVDLPAFFLGLEHLVVALPSTNATSRLVNAAALELLATGASLVNVGRGDTVDVGAVVEALGSGRLGLAVLDVLPVEPIGHDDPLWHVENLVITSHTAAVSRPEDIAPFVAVNLDRFERGQQPLGVVDPTTGY